MVGWERVMLSIKSSVNPNFVKLFAFKPRVEKGLGRFQQVGVLTKTAINKWGTPSVLVLKKNEHIWMCSVYKITGVEYIDVDNYPISSARNDLVFDDG